MQRKFPLFHSHLDLAHSYWETLLQNGGWAIDATCGNGKDTLKLAQILKDKPGSGVIGIDIQKEALVETRTLLDSHALGAPPGHVHLYLQSHEEFPPLALEKPIKLIVYNLGYLPKGNKELTTLTQTTLKSLLKALERVEPGGAICITCYPGHEEGEREERAVRELTAGLSPSLWNVCQHTLINRANSPRLLLLQKVSVL